jgi:hypothetical protein
MRLQTEGYLIVLKPEISASVYSASDVAVRNVKPLGILRKAFAAFPPERYRGINRGPLMSFWSLDSETVSASSERTNDTKSNAKARRRMREILGEPDESVDSQIDEDLLPSVEDAQNVLSLVDNLVQWEIIHVTKADAIPVINTLGYDIGYWGGDHLSLIADTIVAPHWHPPALDDLDELAQKLSCLNEHLLFRSDEDARRFREYYKSKSWAETDEGYEFCIIRVDGVN